MYQGKKLVKTHTFMKISAVLILPSKIILKALYVLFSVVTDTTLAAVKTTTIFFS